MNERIDVVGITRKTYDQIASSYSDKIDGLISESWVGEFERQLLDNFLKMTKLSNPKVLDIGCGNGKDTDYLRRKGAVPVGIDISSGMLKVAKKRAREGTLCQMDMRNLGFYSEAFDGVWANGCIYHVPKIELTQVLDEIRRVLKPMGIFSFNAKTGIGERLEESPKSHAGGPRFYAYYTVEEMGIYLKQASLEVIETKWYPQEIFNEEIFHIWAGKP